MTTEQIRVHKNAAYTLNNVVIIFVRLKNQRHKSKVLKNQVDY